MITARPLDLGVERLEEGGKELPATAELVCEGAGHIMSGAWHLTVHDEWSTLAGETACMLIQQLG
jgi:hypothetical protein